MFNFPQFKFTSGKIRWLIVIKDDSGKEVFPESFVKLDAMPMRNLIGTPEGIEELPSNIVFRQYEVLSNDFNSLMDKLKSTVLHTAILKQYNGAGELLDSWEFTGNLILLNQIFSYDSEPTIQPEMDICWQLNYDKCNKCEQMLSKKTESEDYLGVSINCDKTHVLLQVTDKDSQARIKLISDEVDALIKDLQKYQSQLCSIIK